MSHRDDSAPLARPHWRFPAESVAELARRLDAAGPGATLEVRIGDADDGHPHGPPMTLRVVPADGARLASDIELPDVNDSFLCPPWC